MRKTAFYITTILLCVILYGCMQKGTHFPKGTRLDGLDISGKKPDEIIQPLSDRQRAILSDITFTVSTPTGEEKITPDDIGLHFDTENAVKAALEKGGDIQTELLYDEKKLADCVEGICKKHTVQAFSATAEYDKSGEFTFTEGKDGEYPDKDSIIKSVKEAIGGRKSEMITAQMKKLPPSGDTVEQLQAKNSVMAEFTTYFDHSPLNAENRVKNIIKAAALVNGTVLAPDEVFDTNAVLGDRNEENGWFTAPGIVNGKYEQEYGGGVCQVSTTLYNAALLADLQIVERINHSIPVSYVDLGRDATISTGGPNLRFKNSTQYPVTICAVTDEDNMSVTVKVFGKKADDFAKIELYSEQTGVISPPEPEFVRDTSLRMGEYVTDRKARTGKRAVTYRTYYDKNGNVIKSETVTRDTYAAFSAVILYN